MESITSALLMHGHLVFGALGENNLLLRIFPNQMRLFSSLCWRLGHDILEYLLNKTFLLSFMERMAFVFLFPSMQFLCSFLAKKQFNLYCTIIFLWKTNEIKISFFSIRLWLKLFKSFKSAFALLFLWWLKGTWCNCPHVLCSWLIKMWFPCLFFL